MYVRGPAAQTPPSISTATTSADLDESTPIPLYMGADRRGGKSFGRSDGKPPDLFFEEAENAPRRSSREDGVLGKGCLLSCRRALATPVNELYSLGSGPRKDCKVLVCRSSSNLC